MAVKTPVKATFTGSDVTGLAEYQAADFIGVADGGSGAVTFTAGILTADGTNAFTTVTAPSGTIVGTSDTQTLTNKTINSSSNTITITESNISDLGSYITASSTDTLTNKTFDANGTGNSITNIEVADFATGVVDTDLASVSASDDTLASAKAIKAYIDSENANQMTTITIADDSSTTSSITEADTLQFLGGTGISSTVSGDSVTFAIDNTVTTNSGTQTLTNKTINGSNNTISNIGNAALSNSSISFTDESSTAGSVALGGTLEFLAGEGINTTASGTTLTITGEDASTSNKGIASFSSDNFAVTSGAVTIKDSGVSNAELAGSIANAKLANSTITVTGDTGSHAIDLGDTLSVTGTTNEIETTVTTDTITIGLPNDVTVGNNLTVTGNLTVNGTTTTVATTNTTIADNLLELNSGAASNANDTGILIERGSTGDNAIVAWDESADKFIVGTTTATASDTGNLTITTGTLVANIEGNITGNVTGNADTATTLATARTIAGQSFDGSANITIASTDLSDTSSITLNSATQTLTNKTINSTSNTITITESDISDLGSYITASSTDTLTNKTISGSSNTISGINATSIADGSISNTEFQHLNGVSSNIQTQLDAKATNAFAIAQAVALG